MADDGQLCGVKKYFISASPNGKSGEKRDTRFPVDAKTKIDR